MGDMGDGEFDPPQLHAKPAHAHDVLEQEKQPFL